MTPESSPEFTKKSWFGNLMTTEKDETFTVLVKGKALVTLKADLIHTFLSVSSDKNILLLTSIFHINFFSEHTCIILTFIFL